MSNRYAVMGNPIAHSLSPVLHQAFAEQAGIKLVYEKIQIFDDQFSNTVKAFFKQGGNGLNITLPYKEKAFELCAILKPHAKEAEAVNTLWMEHGILHGDNTDGVGFIRDLYRYINPRNKSILLLGSGGAAKGILGPLLREQPAYLTIANRTIAKAYNLQKKFPGIKVKELDCLDSDYDLIINATSAAFQGKSLLISERLFEKKPFCYDLAYQMQNDTVFQNLAKENGCNAHDGLGMLVEQGAESFYIWHGFRPDTRPVLERLQGMG